MMTDRDAWSGARARLEALQPAQLRAYLSATGWRDQESYGRGRMWTVGTSEGEYEVYQPGDPRTRDYVSRVMELVETIVIVEDRNRQEVLEDLEGAGFEAQHYWLKPATPTGTIPLGNLAEALEGIRKVNTAVVYAELVSEAELVQPNSKPQQIHDLVRKALVGPGRAGSYVVSVRMAAQRLDEEGALFSVEPAQPTRRVSNRLKAAIDSARWLATAGSRVEDAMERRLSANFLDALAAIGGKRDPIGFSVFVGWPMPHGGAAASQTVAFAPEHLASLRNWADLIRDGARDRRVTIDGYVIGTQPSQTPRPGMATVIGQVRGAWNRGRRKYQVELSAELFAHAMQAQRSRTRVTVIGHLVDDGSGPRLVSVETVSLHES